MDKHAYCVYWRWFDEEGNELERRCVTHSWFTSYRKAQKEFDKQKEVLYGNYPDRHVESDGIRLGWSLDDGTYELSAVKIFARNGEQAYLRLVLACTPLK